MTTTASPAAVRPPARAGRRDWSRASRLLVAVPDAVVCALLCVAVVVALALLLGVFLPAVVLPAGVVAAVLGVRLRPALPAPGAADGRVVLGAGVALLVAVAWFLVQVGHTGQAIGVGRDPSQYTLLGLYLVDHRSPDVGLPQAAVDLARAVPGLRTNFITDEVTAANHIQGTSLLSGMLAVLGWLFGTGGVWAANVVLGALGLLAVYAMGRRIVGPLWALLPVVALAVAMPLAEFSRTPYTETLALVFAAGAVLGIWVAAERGALRPAALGGACAGAVMLSRIDGGIVMIGGIVGLTLLAVVTPDPELRARRRRALAVFVLAAAPVGLLGWLDLRVHSPKYLSDLSDLLYPVLAATAALAVVGWLASGPVAGRLLTRAVRDVRRRRRGWAVAAGVLASAAALFLLSRPWWMVNHKQVDPDYWPAVEWRQRAEGLPVDGTQSFDEMTVSWLAWYFGWPLLLVGLAGAVTATVDGVRRDTRLLAVAAVPAVAAAFYLNAVSITPDQVWAFRRLLPVIVPGLLLGAAYGLRRAAGLLARRRAPAWSGIAVLLGAVLAVLPVLTWGPMFGAREGQGTYDLALRMCSLAGDGLLVQVGNYPPTGTMLPAVQELCPGTAAVQTFSTSPVTLQQIADHWDGDGPVTVVTFQPGVLFPTGVGGAAPWTTLTVPQWESVISHRPRRVDQVVLQVWAGRLDSSGTVQALPAFPALS
ncbi:hypothetical protein [Nakamurella endophytica]|uniref:hypothetical protein n=1 Tax=Nakamurella endophytica TaxID=1748367 RepID=UPI001E55E279|nr:hypothetical protein [Nakamurella endophytica]